MLCACCARAGLLSLAGLPASSFTFFSDLALGVFICFSIMDGGWVNSVYTAERCDLDILHLVQKVTFLILILE